MRANCRDTVRPFPLGRWDSDPNFQLVGGIQKIAIPTRWVSDIAIKSIPLLPG